MTLSHHKLRRAIPIVAMLGCLCVTSRAQSPNSEANDGAPADGRSFRRERRASTSLEERRQRMLDALRQRFDVSNDEEWSLISQRLAKVEELRRNSLFGGVFMGTPGGGSDGARSRFGMSGGGSNPEAVALSTAIQNNATVADLKARLERLREVRKQNAEKLAGAQEELRAVLNVRQEAIAVLMGLLP